MTVIVIDKRSGERRELDERGARILVALGKADYANAPSQEYQTRSMEAAPARRGRPPGTKNKPRNETSGQ